MEDGTFPRRPASPFVTATHAVLFQPPVTPRCDVCGAPVTEAADDEAPLPTAGTFVTARGDEIHEDEAPLCRACALALGVTALARWDAEEEEG